MLKVPMKYESVTIPWKISFPVTCSTSIYAIVYKGPAMSR